MYKQKRRYIIHSIQYTHKETDTESEILYTQGEN